MKSLSNYLIEALQVERTNGSYRTVVLLRHEGINTSNLSKEEFIQLMKEDLQNAQALYSKEVRAARETTKPAYMERKRQEAEEFANKKWKTDKRKQEYIDNALANAEEVWNNFKTDIFFDFKFFSVCNSICSRRYFIFNLKNNHFSMFDKISSFFTCFSFSAAYYIIKSFI